MLHNLLPSPEVQIQAVLVALLAYVIVDDLRNFRVRNLVDSGADAKPAVQEGHVRVNGEVETRRGRQLRVGDVVELGGQAARVSDEQAPDDLPW